MRPRRSIEEDEGLLMRCVMETGVGARGLTGIESAADSRGRRACAMLKATAAHSGAHGRLKA
jgi:hypothetical protein